MAKWKLNGLQKRPNADLWMRIDDGLERRKAAGCTTELVKVKGHAKIHGNVIADRLANAAARNMV